MLPTATVTKYPAVLVSFVIGSSYETRIRTAHAAHIMRTDVWDSKKKRATLDTIPELKTN